MHTTTHPHAGRTSRSGTRPSHGEGAVQRVADASIWLLFRLNRVKS